MSAAANAARRSLDTLAELADGPLGLASHAAVPVVVDARLLHLLRVNFFLDEEPLDYAVEAELLLSPVFRDVGDGLFEIEADLRSLLLTSLHARYGMDRILAVANLLWQYAEQTGTWRNRPELEKAQQLTALHLLDPAAAERWLTESEPTAGAEHSLAPGWFTAMRYQFAHQPDLTPTPEREEAAASVDESMVAAMSDTQRHTARDTLLTAYPNRERLAALLDELNRPLTRYATEHLPFAEAVLKVVESAQAEGWLAQLLAEAANVYPSNRQLAEVAASRVESISPAPGPNPGVVGAGAPIDLLAESEVRALAAVYHDRVDASQLLLRAGLRRELHPQTTPTALEYWTMVNSALARGAFPDGRRRILNLAAHDYPVNSVFQTGLADFRDLQRRIKRFDDSSRTTIPIDAQENDPNHFREGSREIPTTQGSPAAQPPNLPLYFFLSYARADSLDDPLLEQFFRDLRAEVRRRSGQPDINSISFFDMTSIQPEQIWSTELRAALSRCRTFVALCSPSYFASEYCGREWGAFVERIDQDRATEIQSGSPLLPVIWTPLRQAPEALADLQYDHSSLGEEYAKFGLRYLMRLKRYHDEYQEFLMTLAERIVLIAEDESLLSPIELPGLYATRNAFNSSPSPPSGPFTH